MASYLDTSFLIKLYVREAESDEVARMLSLRSEVMFSQLLEVELASTIYRLYATEKVNELFRNFRDDQERVFFVTVPVDGVVFGLAMRLIERYSGELKLRSLDALNLATAIHYGADEIGTYDGKLAKAALREGLKVFPERS